MELLAATTAVLLFVITLGLLARGQGGGARAAAERRIRDQLRERRRMFGGARNDHEPPATVTNPSRTSAPGASPQRAPAARPAVRTTYAPSASLDNLTLNDVLARADAALGADDMMEATRCYRAALLHPDRADALVSRAEIFYRLGMLAQHQGNHRVATTMLERATALDPRHNDAIAALADLKQR